MKKRKLLTTFSTVTLSLALLFTTALPALASEQQPALASEENINFNQTTNISQSASSTNPLKVSKVTLNEKSITLNVGSSETLIPTVLPSTATNQNVTWKSSNTKIATVDSDGTVTGIKAGKTTIKVTTVDGKKTANCAVTVKSVSYVKTTGICLNKSTTNLNVGASETLTVEFSPSNATDKNVVWKSSNDDVATVDQNGKVTGVSSGIAYITVSSKDGSLNSECTVTVSSTSSGATIASISNITKTINQNDNYSLPTTIEATMSDGTKKQVSVTWNTLNTSSATLTSFPNPNTVNLVSKDKQDSAKLNSLKIDGETNSDEAQINTLLSSLNAAKKSSNVIESSQKSTAVTSLNIDTSVAGTYTFLGSVNGYSQKVKLTLVINQVSTPSAPNAPTNLIAKAISSSEITVQWDQVSGADYYYVYYGGDGKTFIETTNSDGSKKQWKWDYDYSVKLTNITANTTRYFKVTAVKNGVESKYSNIASATTFGNVVTTKYFPLLSDVPMPVGVNYKKSSITGTTAFYYYDMNAFNFSTFSQLLKPYGWNYYTSDSDSQGDNYYFRKGNTLVAMGWIGYDRVIYGKIH